MKKISAIIPLLMSIGIMAHGESYLGATDKLSYIESDRYEIILSNATDVQSLHFVASGSSHVPRTVFAPSIEIAFCDGSRNTFQIPEDWRMGRYLNLPLTNRSCINAIYITALATGINDGRGTWIEVWGSEK